MWGREHIAASFALVALMLVVCASGAQGAQSSDYPGAVWTIIGPEKYGWSKDKLNAAQEYSKSIDSSSVMIVQHGQVIAEWGDVDRKISSYSVRKSLLSALYGIYSKEGRININSTLAQLGVSDAPDPLTDGERQARVVDLLRARSGIYHAVDFETPQMNKARPLRGSHAPGTFWVYNNWDFNALGTIFEKSAGMPMGKAFYERIAVPLQMQDFTPEDVYYIGGPLSVHRAFHFRITARDFARFGLLYLRGGRWKGQQIVPAEWVQKSSHANEMIQFPAGHDAGGYEYLWWVPYQGKSLFGVPLPDGSYAAAGAGGHVLLIVPSLDLVIVHRWANDPPAHDPATVIAWAEKGVRPTQIGPLLQLILSAAPL